MHILFIVDRKSTNFPWKMNKIRKKYAFLVILTLLLVTDYIGGLPIIIGRLIGRLIGIGRTLNDILSDEKITYDTFNACLFCCSLIWLSLETVDRYVCFSRKSDYIYLWMTLTQTLDRGLALPKKWKFHVCFRTDRFVNCTYISIMVSA